MDNFLQIPDDMRRLEESFNHGYMSDENIEDEKKIEVEEDHKSESGSENQHHSSNSFSSKHIISIFLPKFCVHKIICLNFANYVDNSVGSLKITILEPEIKQECDSD